MQENEGETSGVIMWPQPPEGSSTKGEKIRPTKRRKVQPGKAGGTHRLCHSCQALELDDRSFGAHVSSFGDTCTSPFPDCSEDDALEFKFIPLNYTREDSLPELPSLSQSEKNGCGFCALLAIAARREYCSLEWPTDSYETPRLIVSGAEYAWQSKYGPSCLGIHMDIRSGDRVCSMTIPFQISCSEGECATWLKTRYRPLDRNPLSEKTVNILRSWLHECHDSHEDCADEGASGTLPTRLLDVGGSTLDEEPRLVLSAGLELRSAIDTHYAALSHCWGNGISPPKTETFSISHRLEKIPLHTMPRTYRDAILLTRSLRIRYLWIDSLCIIQDDKADWERESAIMSGVYRNAHITLCALVHSCDDGFLSQVRQEFEIPFKSSVNPQVNGVLSLHERWPYKQDSSWYNQAEDWIEHYDESEWNHRGWTFQEGQFSQRKLICGMQQLYYNCNTTICSENDLIQSETHGLSLMERLSLRDQNDNWDYYREWYLLLILYVERSLTFPPDRLPAVSSLAAMVAEVTKDRFIAGLWEADLPRGLCWESCVPPFPGPDGLTELIRRLKDPKIFVAPSWSWASLQTYKEWRQWSACIPQFQLIEAHAQVDGDNPFGRVAKAHLTILGKLLHVHDFALRDSGSTPTTYIVTSSGSFIANWRLDWKLTYEELTNGLTSGRGGLIEDIEIFMLLICRVPAVKDVGEINAENFNKWCKKWWEVPGERQIGLVLCLLASKGNYMRIGKFETVDWEEGGRKLFESVPEKEIKLV